MQQGRSPWSDPAYAPPPAPRRRMPAPLIVAIVGGTLAFVFLTVVTVIPLFTVKSPKPRTPVSVRPTTPPPAAATGPEFSRIDNLCAMLPKDLFARLVPGATPKYGRNDAGWACTLSAERRRGGVVADRHANVVVDLLKADPDANGTERARQRYASDRNPDSELAESLKSVGFPYGPPRDLTGIGDQAFVAYGTDVRKFVGPGGRAAVTARLHNAFIKVEYGGKDTPYEESDPMSELRNTARPVPEAKAREGAESLARATVRALESCRSCGA